MFSEDQIERAKQELEHEGLSTLLQLPPNFGSLDDRLGDTWALGPIVDNRDADILTRANFCALEKELGNLPEDDYELTSANHWAVGWVTHLSFRVAESDGRPTYVAAWVRCWLDDLADYPVADEFLFSEMEEEARYDTVKHCVMYNANITLKDDIDIDSVVDSVIQHLISKGRYDFCPDTSSPDEEAIKEALECINALDTNV